MSLSRAQNIFMPMNINSIVILVYSLFSLKKILPEEHLQCWCFFVLACKALGKRVLTDSDIEIGEKYLMQFYKTFETLYGQELATPNMAISRSAY